MLLADLGADVVQVDRVVGSSGPTVHEVDMVQRGRRSVRIDLSKPEGVELVLRLAEGADVLIDPFRPGVTERLGVGPDACLARNPRLVYGRMTGWGQDGPLAMQAGHDINYLALSGALEGLGRAGQPPTPPANYLADLGGGAMFLAVGVLAALHERASSGRGQVVDAAMVDGSAALTAFIRGFRSSGLWSGGRGENLFDTGRPWYDVYEAADGRWVAIGCLEARFYRDLLEVLGLVDDPIVGEQHHDPERWPAMRARLAEVIATRSRDEWAALVAGRPQACLSPVLDLDEAPLHPHLAERATYVAVGGVDNPAPAPRFDRTPAALGRPPVPLGADTDEVLHELGLAAVEVDALRSSGVVG
jgi:alpha-methylacyl-CoA racemase